MKITAINGSPKGNNSNTAVMLLALTNGFQDNGDEIKTINLSENKIEYCLGCYSCWSKTPGTCVQKDDMEAIIRDLEDSDVIILGTPMYFNNVSGTMKAFIDRLTSAGGDPHSKQGSDKKNPKFIMVSNCGFPIRQQFDVISLWIKHFAKLMQTEVLEEFYTTNGKILTASMEGQKEARNNYIEYLTQCGRELSKNKVLSSKNKSKLTRSIMDF